MTATATTTYRVRRYGSDVYTLAERREDAYRLASLRSQCADCGADILEPTARAVFEFPSLHAEPVAYLVAVCVPCAPTIAERLAWRSPDWHS